MEKFCIVGNGIHEKITKRELLPIQVDRKISYTEKTRSLKFLRITWGSNQGGGSGVRNNLHYPLKTKKIESFKLSV